MTLTAQDIDNMDLRDIVAKTYEISDESFTEQDNEDFLAVRGTLEKMLLRHAKELEA